MTTRCLPWFATVSLMCANCTGHEPAAAADAPTVEILTTDDGLRFGIWPRRPSQPAPTLVILSGALEETLSSAYFRQAGTRLADRGYLSVSIDLPCHGQELRAGEPAGLTGWRARCAASDDFVADFTNRLRRVLDELIARQWTDASRVAAVGTSRGGFMALHFAAVDARVRCVAAFAPVTDLRALTEFRGLADHPLAARLDLRHQVEPLSDRALWMIIGDRDQRVDTDKTIALARGITAAALAGQGSPRVDLHVVAQPRGHTVPAGSAESAAEWIERHCGAAP
jgi:dienelactone hydrolase